MNFPSLLCGVLAAFTVAGLGRLVLRLVCPQPLAWHWHVAGSALGGQAAVMVMVEAVLLSGGGPHALRLLGIVLLGAAIAGHLSAPGIRRGAGIAGLLRTNKVMAAVVTTVWMINLIAALAPSTKIDELYAYMLAPKRIIEDGRLHYYLLPLESAVMPHMHYQLALSVLHAAGAPDAGNLLSLGYSIVLTVFLFGFVVETTGNSRLAGLVAALCSVGVYGTVWHTTGGAAALGDLATVVAVAGVLMPDALLKSLGPFRYAAILATVASVAAATKLSLWPLAFALTALITYRTRNAAGAAKRTPAIVAVALLPWAILHLPMMVWTYLASGSFWGPVLANAFGPSVFTPDLLRGLERIAGFHPANFLSSLRYAAIEFPPVCLVAMVWVLWAALRGNRASRLVGILLLGQLALVTWKFSLDLRFLGGLQYAAVIAAALSLANAKAEAAGVVRVKAGQWLVSPRSWILVLAVLPWLAVQLYYIRPMAEAVTGMVPRDQFLGRYVALSRDFAALDAILPKDAVLYVDSAVRLPNFYAPRPVVLTPLDLRGRRPVYRIELERRPDSKEIDSASALGCGGSVYEDDRAVIDTFRTPGRNSFEGPVNVRRCETVASERPAR